MIDFPITELLDDSIYALWLERHLHPEGLKCPGCGSMERRLFREQGHFRAYRCRSCHGYYTPLTGTAFENPTTTVCRDLKTRQRPYVATYEAMINAKRVTPALICRMYFGTLSAHTNDT